MATTPFLFVEIRCSRLPLRTMAITTTQTPSTKSNNNNNNINAHVFQQPRLRTIFCQVRPIAFTAIYLPVFPLFVIVLSCVCVVMYYPCESYHCDCDVLFVFLLCCILNYIIVFCCPVLCYKLITHCDLSLCLA